MTHKIKAVLSDLGRKLSDLYGPRLVRAVLYGSQVRGEADDQSDIDVLVVLKGPVRPGDEITRTGEMVAALSLANDVVVSCAFVSADRFEAERTPFLMNVRREGVAV